METVDAASWWITVGGLGLAFVLALAALSDQRTMRIPNWLTYPALFFVLLLNAAWSSGVIADTGLLQMGPLDASKRLGAIGIKESLVGMSACFGVMFLNYFLTGRGAGDVKLAAVIGASLGMKCGVSAILFAMLLAGSWVFARLILEFGPVAVLHFFYQQIFPPSGGSVVDCSALAERLKRPIPLAGAFGSGVILVFLVGHLFD